MRSMLLAGFILALAACASPTAPAAKASPNHVSNSRYILISNNVPPFPGCYDGGNGYWVCP